MVSCEITFEFGGEQVSCQNTVTYSTMVNFDYRTIIVIDRRIYRTKEIQEIVLISPMGVSKLMDLLSDNREVIRNDVISLNRFIFNV